MKKLLYIGGAIFGICTGLSFLIQSITNARYLAGFGKLIKGWNDKAEKIYQVAEPAILKETSDMVDYHCKVESLKDNE